MKMKVLILIATGLIIASCGSNSNQSANQSTNDNSQKILVDTAFVTLENFEYVDNTNGDFSGGSKDGRTIKVIGSTNFPDGTIIDIQTTGFIVSSRKGGMPDTYAEVKVQDGKFSATLNPWNITDTIEFRIFTSKQTEELLNLVGKNGEKLKIRTNNLPEFEGVVLYQSDNFSVNTEKINEIKGIKATTYKIFKSSDYKQSYEKALADFVMCWKKKDWNCMEKYCQTSEGVNTSDLKSKFDIVEVLGFKILSSKEGEKLPSGNTLMVIEFELVSKSFNEMKGIQTKKLKANVIEENNKWGVNSISVTSGLYN